MDFEKVITSNAGKDINICIESSDGKRENYVIKRYLAVKDKADGSLGIFSSSDRQEACLKLDRNTVMTDYDIELSLLLVRGTASGVQYFIFITDNIFAEENYFLRKQIEKYS